MNGAAYYFVTWSEKIEKAYQYMKRRKKDDVRTGTSAQCQVPFWVGGEFGGEWIHVYVWLSLFAVHLKLSQHG